MPACRVSLVARQRDHRGMVRLGQRMPQGNRLIAVIGMRLGQARQGQGDPHLGRAAGRGEAGQRRRRRRAGVGGQRGEPDRGEAAAAAVGEAA